MPNNYFIRPFIVTVCVLLLPFVAMFFDDATAWGIEDFVAGFILLFGMGTLYEFLSRKVHTKEKRALIAITLTILLLFIWAHLAVGIV